MAAEAAGFETVGQCEWADFPTKVLERHWPAVPRWRDIRTLTGSDFFARTGRRTVDVISGGFPCQPFSVAGKQKGKSDDRYLWPEMLRVIGELAPGWVVGENVPGILRIAAGQVVADLERAGYDVAVFDFEAAAVGAWHRRERIFFVAHMQGDGKPFDLSEQSREKNADLEWGRPLCDRTGAGLPDGEKGALGKEREAEEFEQSDCRAAQPGMGGMAYGLPDWMDGEPEGIPRTVGSRKVKDRVGRIHALGNSVVPRQGYPIFRAIAEEIRRKQDGKRH